MTDTMIVRLYDTDDKLVATAEVITKLAARTHMFKWRNRYFRYRGMVAPLYINFEEAPEPYSLDDAATECG